MNIEYLNYCRSVEGKLYLFSSSTTVFAAPGLYKLRTFDDIMYSPRNRVEVVSYLAKTARFFDAWFSGIRLLANPQFKMCSLTVLYIHMFQFIHLNYVSIQFKSGNCQFTFSRKSCTKNLKPRLKALPIGRFNTHKAAVSETPCP